jgi:hypothetical protein
MPTWFKIHIILRKMDEVVEPEGLVSKLYDKQWYKHPYSFDLDLVRIRAYHACKLTGPEGDFDAISIEFTDDNTLFGAYTYREFKSNVIPRYDEVVNTLGLPPDEIN